MSNPESNSENDKRIDYIEFPTTDLAATKRFFAAVFGWEFVDYGPEYASFNDGRLDGGFYSAETSGMDRPLIVLYAEQLEEVQASILANGGSIVKETYAFPGGRRFHFSEPGGNTLAVWTDR